MVKQKMTWEERWEMHWELHEKYREQMMDALHEFQQTGSMVAWEEYKRLNKLANKHWGIHQAMWTKKAKDYFPKQS